MLPKEERESLPLSTETERELLLANSGEVLQSIMVGVARVPVTATGGGVESCCWFELVLLLFITRAGEGELDLLVELLAWRRQFQCRGG